MSNDTLKETCSCPIECESISYFSYYVSTPFKAEELCSRQPDGLMNEFYENKFPQQFVRKLKKFKGLISGDNLTINDNEICKKDIQYRAEVKFQLATNTMSVTVISRRLSFFDKLSGFGKLNSFRVFELNIYFVLRWYIGTVHWHQYSQYCGSCFLAP